jgi:lipopolysaccharide/colanic/teichoic acid biosynthesis glycosyltransferase
MPPSATQNVALSGYADFSENVFSFSDSGALSISPNAGTYALEARCRELDARPYAYRVAKRVFDLVFSAAAIAVLLIPCLILCVLIALDTKAWPIYSQERVGKYGHVFHIYKFRTMVKDSENVYKYLNSEQMTQWKRERKVDNDPRITRLGRILRATSLDELPQLINVFLGQLSLIGPRPVTEDELSNYGAQEPLFLSVPSGVTGLWQVSARNNATYETGERQSIELDYVSHASMSEDANIFIRTFKVMFAKTRTGK